LLCMVLSYKEENECGKLLLMDLAKFIEYLYLYVNKNNIIV